jgi:hypothetical protein
MRHITTAVDFFRNLEQFSVDESSVWSRETIKMDPQTISPPLPLEVIYWASSSEDSTQKVKFCDVHPEFPWIISAEKNTINVWDFVRSVISLSASQVISVTEEIVSWKNRCTKS